MQVSLLKTTLLYLLFTSTSNGRCRSRSQRCICIGRTSRNYFFELIRFLSINSFEVNFRKIKCLLIKRSKRAGMRCFLVSWMSSLTEKKFWGWQVSWASSRSLVIIVPLCRSFFFFERDRNFIRDTLFFDWSTDHVCKNTFSKSFPIFFSTSKVSSLNFYGRFICTIVLLTSQFLPVYTPIYLVRITQLL